VKNTNTIVFALDQRGHGLSSKPDTNYTTKQIVEEDSLFAESHEVMPAESPIVVGHSWGATIALAYAATYPDKVAGLVLVDGGMGNMRDRPGGDDWERVARELAPPDFAGTPRETFLDFYRKNPYLAPVWDEQLEDMVLNIVQLREDDTVGPRLSRANHMQILRSMWETDNLALAAKVRCPVLMISAETGATDERSNTWAISKREGAQKMLAALSNSPKAEFLIMPDTIHDIPLQRPKELVEAILNFFDQ
jgi:pimeloyl-ACP methyl ester carboxylesterase